MSEWISVKNRLPEDGKRYPVLIKGKMLFIGTLTLQNRWLDDQMGEIKPSHWMPLPELPND